MKAARKPIVRIERGEHAGTNFQKHPDCHLYCRTCRDQFDYVRIVPGSGDSCRPQHSEKQNTETTSRLIWLICPDESYARPNEKCSERQEQGAFPLNLASP